MTRRLPSLAQAFAYLQTVALVFTFNSNTGAAASPNEQPNTIQRENAKPGTTGWHFYWATLAQSWPTNGIPEIEGYASLTSVPRGGSIALLVNTPEPLYTIEIYRLGWYGGKGGRLMAGPVHRAGVSQPIPVTPTNGTRLVECNWRDPYVITIPTNSPDADGWVSGIYWVKLTAGTSHLNSFIEFVVRDDERPSTFLVQRGCTTSQAYNEWGGVSLYASKDTNGQARAVSFNRPYLPIDSSMVQWEWPMIHYLERKGLMSGIAAVLMSTRCQVCFLALACFSPWATMSIGPGPCGRMWKTPAIGE